jgi:hypothetical protein
VEIILKISKKYFFLKMQTRRRLSTHYLYAIASLYLLKSHAIWVLHVFYNKMSATIPFSVRKDTSLNSLYTNTLDADTISATSANVDIGGSYQVDHQHLLSTPFNASSVALTPATVPTNQGQSAIAIGNNAGTSNQGTGCIAIGASAGQISQSVIGNLQSSVAIGAFAGYDTQGVRCVAIGDDAGQYHQGQNSVAIGQQAGYGGPQIPPNPLLYQGANCVAVGIASGKAGQSQNAVAVGANAGETTQGQNSVAIGYQAGNNNLGDNSICIGPATSAAGFSNAIVLGNGAAATEDNLLVLGGANQLDFGNAGAIDRYLKVLINNTPYRIALYTPV